MSVYKRKWLCKRVHVFIWAPSIIYEYVYINSQLLSVHLVLEHKPFTTTNVCLETKLDV